MRMHAGFIDCGGGKLYYRTAGEGPNLVLLHAGLVDSRMWDSQFPVFARKYQVLCYDLRGCGHSSSPEAPFSPSEDLNFLLDHLDIKNASLVGLSQGGGIAIDFTLIHPERVNALVLSNPSLGGFQYKKDLFQSGEKFHRTGKTRSPRAAIEILLTDRFWSRALPLKSHPEARRKFIRMVKDNPQVFLWDPDLIQSLEPPALDRLGDIKVPTLLIASQDDLSENQDIIDLLEMKIPYSTRVTISECSHMVNLDQPERFNQCVLYFLERELKG